MIRKPYRAGLFYPGQAAACRAQLAECFAKAEAPILVPGGPVAAIVPHAGWAYSGPVAAGALRSLASGRRPPEVVVLFGAVHVPGVDEATLSDATTWETPLGPVAVDPTGAEALSGVVASGSQPHRGEHSLEVEVPFVQSLFPKATILPIAVPADGAAAQVGRDVAAALEFLGDRVVFVGSTDMSHYGYRFGFVEKGVGPQALRWVKDENDARMLRLMEEMKVDAIVPEAEERWNACGAGAIAATLAAAKARGRSRGRVTGYTTSADVTGDPDPTDFVGYSGLVY